MNSISLPLIFVALMGVAIAGPNKKLSVESNLDLSQYDATIKTYDEKIRSLESRIIYLEAKHGLFDTEFKNMTAIFTLIVTVALSVSSLTVYLKVHSENKAIQSELKKNVTDLKVTFDEKIEKYEDAFSTIKKKHLQSETKINRATANIFAVISVVERKEGNHILSIMYATKSASFSERVYKIGSEKAKVSAIGVVKANLTNALVTMDQMILNKNYNDKNDINKDIIKNLEHVHNIDDSEVKELCAQLRTKLSSVYRKGPESDAISPEV